MQGSFSNRRKLEQLGILLGIQTCSHMAKVNTKGAHDPKLNLKDSVVPHPKGAGTGPCSPGFWGQVPASLGAIPSPHLGLTRHPKACTLVQISLSWPIGSQSESSSSKFLSTNTPRGQTLRGPAPGTVWCTA